VLAARTLAVPGGHVLALLGCGAQGRAHARAFVRSLGVTAIRVWSPFPDERRLVAAQLSEALGISVVAASSPAVALQGADLVVTATTSTEPLLDRDMLELGATVISVGSFAPDRREVGDDVVAVARVVVDDVSTAQQQAGPVVHAIASGAVQPGSLVGLGQVLLGEPGRRSPNELVFYNSVGVGIQDAAAAWLAVHAAKERGIGQLVDL
jgi:ornithine cyclodeaminase